MVNCKKLFSYLKNIDVKTVPKKQTSKTYFASTSMVYLILKSNNTISNKA